MPRALEFVFREADRYIPSVDTSAYYFLSLPVQAESELLVREMLDKQNEYIIQFSSR